MMKYIQLLPSFIFTIAALCVFALQPIYAQDFTQGYATEDTLIRGSVVAAKPDDINRVEGSTSDTIDKLFGVVVKSGDSPITLTSDTAGVFVATSGKYEVLVSNLNGPVFAGDYVTASSLKGVGMVADSRQSHIFGRAVQDLDFSKPGVLLSSDEVKAEDGTVFKAGIGRILVDIKVEENPLNKNPIQRVPDVILRVGQAIGGDDVNPIRVYAAFAIMVVAFGVGGSMLYVSIRSSMISIGRNPLSRGQVMKGFTRVALIAIGIFIIGVIAVYLVLTN